MSSVVPEGWNTVSLAEGIDILSGYPFDSSSFTDDSSKTGLIRIRDLVRQKVATYFDGAFDDNYLIRKGDVLIGMDGDFNIVKWNSAPSLLNQRICKVTVAGKIFDLAYLYQDLQKDLLEINNQTGSTTVKHLSVKDIRGIHKSYPPLHEQKKIASILTSVDEVIENTQKQIDKLQDLKKATMNELLTKGIGHTDFKDSELGRIPKSWEVIKLSGLCSLHYGKSPKEIEDDDGMYPIYGTGGIVGKTNSALHAGKSIVLGRKGSIDNVSFVDSPLWAIDTTYYVEGKNVDIKWLFYRLQYEGLKKYNEASGVPSLNRDTLYNIAIQSPPASEQTQICVILDAVESHISSLNDKLHQTQSLKKSLMQDLLTGKVRVTEN